MSKRADVCVWIAVSSLVAPLVASAQGPTGGPELVELILRDGPQAVAIRAGLEVTRRDQGARLAHPNPGVVYSREGAGFTEFLQAEQTLPIFGVRSALSRASTAAITAAEADRDAQLWTLRAQAEAAVASLIAEQERLQIAEAYADEIDRTIEILRVREREGEGSRFDRLRAEEEQHEARRVVTTFAVAVADARAVVAGMLPRGVTVPRLTSPLYDPREPAAVETLHVRAEASRPELRTLRARLDRTQFESDAARRARLPSPTLFGGLKRAETGSGRTNSGIFGVSLSVPLFDTGAREVARWTAERLRLEAERAAVEHEIHVEIDRAAETLALRRAAVDRDRDSAAADLTQIATVAYRDGAVGILELLDAFRTASRARLRSIDIRFEARLAQIALERAVGDVLWP